MTDTVLKLDKRMMVSRDRGDVTLAVVGDVLLKALIAVVLNGDLPGARGGDLTAAAKDAGRLGAAALGNNPERDGRVFALAVEVAVVSLRAIGLELGVPGGVGGTRLGDC
jgi:hypothetical protein